MSTQEETRGNTLNGSTYQGVSQLLNSIARDLDHMLYELGQSPPLSPVNTQIVDELSPGSHYRRAVFQQSTQSNSRNSSGDALLEQFVQNLIDSLTLPGTPDGRSSVLSSTSLSTLGLNGGGQSSDNSSQISEPSNAVVPTSDGNGEQSCDISVLERIIRTHPVWFLPGITRAGAIHLLQGKDAGNFIVRKSSKPSTMAISVRLPDDKGPYIEHYLIEATGREYHLEGSVNHFEAIPTLVAHYCQCCDELPVRLTLPQAIMVALTRQELSSIAMLGQDFWVSSMAKSTTPPPEGSESKAALNSDSLMGLPFPVFSTFGHKTSSASTTILTSSYSTQFRDSSASLNSNSTSSPSETKTANPSPPPPPPRWCKPPSTFATTANFTVTTTVTFNVNQSITNLPVNSVSNKLSTLPVASSNNEPSKRPQTLTNVTNGKTVKYRKRTTHYKQSNVIDSPPDYYRSSLADKISDYEDIWGTPSKPETPVSESKFEFLTFKSKNSKHSKNGSRKENLKDSDSSQNVNQTDFEKAQAIENDLYSKDGSSNAKENKHYEVTSNLQYQPEQVQNKTGYNNSPVKSTTQVDKKPDSPFYIDPIDALPVKDQFKNCKFKFKNGSIGKLKSRTKIPSRLLNHRHSDPNIQWPLSRNGGALETIFAAEDMQALSSSLDNLNNRPPLSLPTSKDGLINAGFSSHSSQINKSCDQDENSLPLKINFNSVMKHKNCCESLSSPKKLIVKLIPNKSFNDTSWPVDSSWEWLGNDDESLLGDSDNDDESTVESLIRKDAKFPLGDFRKETSLDSSIQCSDLITVEDLIQQKSPDLHVPEIQPLTKSNLLRVSEYDNLDDNVTHEKDNLGYDASETASSVTEFSEPWDSYQWDQLLHPRMSHRNEADIIQEEERERKENRFNASIEDYEIKKLQINTQIDTPHLEVANDTAVSSSSSMSIVVDDGTSLSSVPTNLADQHGSLGTQKKIKAPSSVNTMNAIFPRNKKKGLGDTIKEYVLRLSEDNSTIFGKTIQNFIQCTLESPETNPHVVMRNVRQFMSGIKNYLVKNGEGQFETVVQVERSKLKANEFLNLDAILESVLNKIVIKPLKKYIYQLFVNEYTRNGSLKLLSDSIKFARTKIPEEFGIKPGSNILQGNTMDAVHHFLRKLQVVYSPMKKLHNLLASTTYIFKTIHQDQVTEEISMSTDDFLPLLMYVLVHCGMIAAEIEADYMWGLLHPSLLTGEGGYYLTTLSSAVHVLKNFQRCHELQCRKLYNSVETKETIVPNISDLHGFMKILIPDEFNGSIISKTFPIRPRMNTKEVGKMIAHKFNITNPQDYALFKLVNGEETLLLECECPHTVKAELQVAGIDCAFAYKRIDAKIAWPLKSKSHV